MASPYRSPQFATAPLGKAETWHVHSSDGTFPEGNPKLLNKFCLALYMILLLYRMFRDLQIWTPPFLWLCLQVVSPASVIITTFSRLTFSWKHLARAEVSLFFPLFEISSIIGLPYYTIFTTLLLFGVYPSNKHCPSAQCAYAANLVW
jgi:hypothetical protein